MEILELSGKERFEMRDEFLALKRDYAIPEKDPQYSELLGLQARHLIREKALPDSALSYLAQAHQYLPFGRNQTMYAMEAYFVKGEFETAYNLAIMATERADLSEIDGLAAIIHCAINANLFQEALEWCTRRNSLIQEDPFLEIEQRLRNGDSLETLGELLN